MQPVFPSNARDNEDMGVNCARTYWVSPRFRSVSNTTMVTSGFGESNVLTVGAVSYTHLTLPTELEV